MKMHIRYEGLKAVSWQLDDTGTDVPMKFFGVRFTQWLTVFSDVRKTREALDLNTDIVTIEFYNERVTK